MSIKIAKLLLKYIQKVCNQNEGLNITKYSKLDGTKIYELEWYDTAE